MERFAVRSARVLLDGELTPATVVVNGDRVAAVLGFDDDPDAPIADHGDMVISPALIDTHVHVNEPGRTAWEGFATATRAAAAGGVAAIIDMPLNSIPPTTTGAGLRAKQEAARPAASVDVGFWGGIVPGNRDEVAALASAGVFGFKSFLVESGVDEFECIGLGDLDAALDAAGSVGRPLLVHAESPDVISAAPPCGSDYASFLASRPPEAEIEAVAAVIDACRRTGGAAHILHLSAADALAPLAAARAEGLAITVETCPHYLALSSEDVPAGACEFKCAPPIRDHENRERLWSGLADGIIDMVVSDHSPCTPDLKGGGFDTAWGGIASLELRLPIVWTEASRRGFAVADVIEWTAAAPARLAGLDTGQITPGNRADLLVWDPDAQWVVDGAALHQRHPVTPYQGRSLLGTVQQTFVRGRMVFDGDTVDAGGRLLERA